MKFTVLVAADIFGQKLNLELSFGSVPTMSELTRHIDYIFTNEEELLAGSGRSNGFRTDRMQILMNNPMNGWT